MKSTITTLVLFLIGMSFAAGGGPNSGASKGNGDGSQTPGVTQDATGTCDHEDTGEPKGTGKPQGAGKTNGQGAKATDGAQVTDTGEPKGTGKPQGAGQTNGQGAKATDGAQVTDTGEPKGTGKSQGAGQTNGQGAKAKDGSQVTGSTQKGGKKYGLSKEFDKGMPADLKGKVDAVKKEANKKRQIINEATPEQAQVIKSQWRKGSQQKKDAAVNALPEETRGKVRGMLKKIDENNTNKEEDMRQRGYGRDRLQDPDKKKTSLDVP